jgi:hypothetical protein
VQQDVHTTLPQELFISPHIDKAPLSHISAICLCLRMLF